MLVCLSSPGLRALVFGYVVHLMMMMIIGHLLQLPFLINLRTFIPLLRIMHPDILDIQFIFLWELLSEILI